MNVIKNTKIPTRVTSVVKTPSTSSFVPQCNGSSLKDVKNRIKSVTSIRKITKTMNMIATARLRQAQQRNERARAFFGTVEKPFDTMAPPPAPKKALFVPISSDKGLCGGNNSNISKLVRAQHKEKTAKQPDFSLALRCIGEKAPVQLARDYGKNIEWVAGETAKKPMNFLAASLIADKLIDTDAESIVLFFNKFNSVMSFTPQTFEFRSPSAYVENMDAFSDYEFEEGQADNHIRDVAEYFSASLVFAKFIESQTSELGGRMTAMDSATRNAGEMIKRLTIQYNRRRQAVITTELTEIISGAAAVQEVK